MIALKEVTSPPPAQTSEKTPLTAFSGTRQLALIRSTLIF